MATTVLVDLAHLEEDAVRLKILKCLLSASSSMTSSEGRQTLNKTLLKVPSF
jgi:hypothetical protein